MRRRHRIQVARLRRDPFPARVVLLLLRLTQAILVAWLVMAVPLPVTNPWVTLQAPLGAFLGVVLLGMALYDTLFYSRYRP